MKSRTEDININEEFEKILPPTPRKSLFDDSEDYESLREYIIAQPYNSLCKRNLPFVDVELIDYVDFRRNEAIDMAKEEHKYLFFIRQSKKGKEEYCNAVGYYQEHSKNFVLMPYSYIVTKAYEYKPFLAQKTEKKHMDGVNRYITHSITFNSPEEAATFVLGQKAKLDEWVDGKGKGLLDYFPDLKDRCFKVKQERGIIKEHEKIKLKLGEIVASLQNVLSAKKEGLKISEKNTNIDESIQKEPQVGNLCYVHLVSVNNSSIKAFGYYDLSNRMFVLKEGSTWSIDVTSKFRFTATEIRRRLYIKKYCKLVRGNIIQSVDVVCKSPDIAACFVLGDIVNGWEEWIDENGMTLSEIINKRI